jgi:hypothetical protein
MDDRVIGPDAQDYAEYPSAIIQAIAARGEELTDLGETYDGTASDD